MPSSTLIHDAPAPAAVPNVRAHLREATAARHAQVDQHMPLARPAPTLADYLAHLLILRDWFDALQQALPDLDGMAAERTALLADAREAADALGRSLPPPQSSAPMAERIDALRELGTGPHAVAARLGARYVVEGSHLGGRMLHRRLHERLAPHPLRYLQGDAASRQWPALLAELSAQCVAAPDLQAATRAAEHAFDLLIDALPAPHAHHGIE